MPDEFDRVIERIVTAGDRARQRAQEWRDPDWQQRSAWRRTVGEADAAFARAMAGRSYADARRK